METSIPIVNIDEFFIFFIKRTLHPSYSERVGAAKIVHYSRVFTISEFTINEFAINGMNVQIMSM
jgi:hypothetical protein